MNIKNIPFSAVAVCMVLLLNGCSSIINSRKQKAPVVQAYLDGNNERALSMVDMRLVFARYSGDELMWLVESGALNFYLKNYDECIKNFSRAEELIGGYDKRALVSVRDFNSEVATGVTNLNSLPYKGWCRDRILLSVLKSLSYLGTGRESAFRAQLRRLRDTQKQVIENYKEYFEAEKRAMARTRNKNRAALKKQGLDMEFDSELEYVKEVAHQGYGNFLNPLAIFLSGLGAIRDKQYENARIEFQRLYEAMPDSGLAQKYYVTCLKKTNREIPEKLKDVAEFDFELGGSVVFILFANGRGAALKQIALHFPVMAAWPVCEYFSKPYDHLNVAVDGKTLKTELLANMDGILSQEYIERLPGIVARIVISTVVKETATYGGAYAAGRANELAGALVYLGATVYRYVFNTADTRCWEFLPKEYQLAQFPLPENKTFSISPSNEAFEKEIKLSDECRAAIIYVNTPSRKNFTCNILEFH